MRTPLISLGLKALIFPPRLAVRLAGQVGRPVVGTARLLGGEVLERVRPEHRPEPEGPAPTPRAGTARQVEPERQAEAERPMAGVAESLAEAIADATPDGPPVEHADLPIEDFDHLTLGAVRSRIRKLGLEELGQLQAYEAAHANRLQVLTILTNRIRDLESSRDDMREPVLTA